VHELYNSFVFQKSLKSSVSMWLNSAKLPIVTAVVIPFIQNHKNVQFYKSIKSVGLRKIRVLDGAQEAIT